MKVIEAIDFACKQTMIRHPDIDMPINLLGYLKDEVGTNAFTKTAGARECIGRLAKDDIRLEIIKQAIKIGLLYEYYVKKGKDANAFQLPYGSECAKYVRAVRAGQNAYLYPLTTPGMMDSLTKGFAEVRYLHKGTYLKSISNINLGAVETRILDDKKKVQGFVNLDINYSTVNKCREDILSGKQLKNDRNEYSLDGNMFAVNDIGMKRYNQEDAVLILTHPNNRSFKCLAVSDGMGGRTGGELASKFVMTRLTNWFESINEKYFERPGELQILFSNEINNISNDFYNQYNERFGSEMPGATFSGALVCENKTLVGNVGDSRVYISKDGELTQVTKDDSMVQYLYEFGDIKSKDEMRFHKSANKLTRCMGVGVDVSPKITIVDNNDYDLLMIFSDGVTDCLSDEQIKITTKVTSREKLARAIVDNAKTTNSTLQTNSPDYYKSIEGGKDNESAVVFSPRR